MALEIPQKQYEEHDYREHANPETVTSGIRTAPCGASWHANLDALFVTKCRWKTKLKETLPFKIFRA
jgi:hypothetical protein